MSTNGTVIADRLSNKRQKRPPSVGPVVSLESHVQPEWWKSIFNSTYLKTDADVVEDRSVTRSEVDVFVQALGIEYGHHILDLACGQGRHAIELANRGFTNVEGLDRSSYLIRRARKTARDSGMAIRFREGDARRLPYPADSFDRILLAGNSFGYFQDVEDDTLVLREAARVLKPDGLLLVDLTDADYLRQNFAARSWEWIGKTHFVCRERSLSEDGDRLTTREIVSHIEKGIVVDQFYSERLYDRPALDATLELAGFDSITFHGEHEPASVRNQDTGMMGHRLLVSGRIVKRSAPESPSERLKRREVVIVMGDPRREDKVKPGSIFDEDDFRTIDLLREALSKVPGYNFTYLDDHESLISDLTRLAGKTDLVLNLCDEGFRNDALMELHVPAMLDVLGMPYTGGGPQCLAYCYDKSLIRGISREMGIPVAEATFVDPGSTHFDLPFGLPAIVKPNFGDSSMGITQASVAYSLDELAAAIDRARAIVGLDRPVLVERFLTGKDISVGLIGNAADSFHVLPITEEDYSAVPGDLPEICGFEAKWDESSPYWDIRSIPAELPTDVESFVVDSCMRLFQRVGCRDYARFDWRLDGEGRPHLLEVNPNPGWCWDGHLAKMCHIAGLNYPEMLGLILSTAERRVGMRPHKTGCVMRALSTEAPTLEALMAF
ncbi:MAG: methyltransferase domain-containing protein [Chloroflexi bacterium]|nr:methyltransferase domain-containing protein [Chloroflexota bacterium]